ncbi:hypothetical protein H4R22_004052 [Coemansia sp. RSA 1290]|nr:hypothetical protein H4R22_004052 [Coemansia sp. RSA 1290]KAJ2652347.1 hypothetical protein IWW40_001202 [Coemansia sp. RSA 1250]
MHISKHLLASTIIGATLAAPARKCDHTVTRKEVRDLSPGEWKIIADTVARMQEYGWLSYFSSIHSVYFPAVHGMSQFLPFHRRFVRHFEMVAQRFDSRFVLPYWNEFADYRDPAASEVLSERFLGGNGQGSDSCVMDGIQANWTMHYPQDHCLRRKFNNGDSIKPWFSSEYIDSVIQRSETMAVFRERIENTQHGLVHLSVNGDMAAHHSINDFLFLLHHTFVDRIWAKWQADGHELTFDGPDHDQQNMTLDSQLQFYHEPIESVITLGRGIMCYEYADPESSQPDILTKRSADTRLLALPRDVLCKWYPKTCAETPGDGTGKAAMVQGKQYRFLPMPADVSAEAAALPGFDADAIKLMTDNARQFVADMNAAGYPPLY